MLFPIHNRANQKLGARPPLLTSGPRIDTGVGGVPDFYPHFLTGRGVGFFHTKALFWGGRGVGKTAAETPHPKSTPFPQQRA